MSEELEPLGGKKNTIEDNEKYRLLVSSIRDYAIFMLDTEGNIISWNEGARLIKKYEDYEIIGQHFSVFYPEDMKAIGYPKYELEMAVLYGKFEDEGWRIRKDGTRFFANVVISTLYNKDNKHIGFTKVTKDLTERREAEERLRLSEERYRLIVEGVKDYAIFMLDPKGYVMSWNEGAKRMKYYNDYEIIGKHFSVFYPDHLKAQGYTEFELDVAKKQGRFEDEGWRVRKDGSVFYANVIITAIYNKDGHHKGFSKITKDLTERREVEEKLRQSEEKYRLLIEGVKDYAIFMLSPSGHIVSWNEGAKRLKRYEDHEIIGQHFSVFYPKEKIEMDYPAHELRESAAHGVFEDEGWRVRKDGSVFYANVVITAIKDAHNKLIGYSKITRDLTERKIAEEKLQISNVELESRVRERTEELYNMVKELKRINEDLDNFIYTASHDLKAPVSNIEGLVRALKDELISQSYFNVEVSTLMEMINASVQRFQKTIKSLASVNQIQKAHADELIVIDLPSLIEDVKASIEHLVKESNAKISVKLDDFEGFRFSLSHMQSLIYNFLTNAIKYRSPVRDLEVVFSAYRKQGKYVISVKDNGIGIREENKQKVFKLFQRFNNDVEGSGVGLYIIKKIVDNAGGEVKVESDYGNGSTFIVSFPESIEV